MITVWKFELEIQDKTFINIPKNAEILTVQLDQKTNKPCLWVLVDTNKPEEERCFKLFGTGHQIHYDMGVEMVYIGTYQSYNGSCHVFEHL